MKDMKFQLVTLVSAITFSVLSATATMADPAQDLEECRSISVELERLACLEAAHDQLRAAGMTPDSVLKSSVAEIEPSAHDSQSNSEKRGWYAKERKVFGLRLPFTGGKADTRRAATADGVERDGDGNITGISSSVADVSSGPRGKLTITLVNGQIWRQKDGRIKAKAGDKVVISSAALGSYLMTVGKGRSVRATRVDDGSNKGVAPNSDVAETDVPAAASEPKNKEGLFARFGKRFGAGKKDATEADFGKTPANSAKESEDDPVSMTQTVVTSVADPYGDFTITLENGQIWRQIDGRLKVREGDSVTIDRSGFGSHFLQIDNKGRSVRVKRVS